MNERKLKVSYRDVRLTAKGLRLAHRLELSEPQLSLVQAFMRRYHRQRPWCPRPGFIFRHDHPGMLSRHVHHWAQVHLTPRVALTLVHRLLTRSERIEAVTPARGSHGRQPMLAHEASWQGDRTVSSGFSLVTPVTKVFRRSTVGSRDPESTQTATDLGREPRVKKRQEGHAGQPVVAPGPVNINHLTHQVIQAIDQRIIAQRERLGRI